MKTLLLALCLTVAACGGGTDTPTPPPSVQKEITWTQHADIQGTQGNYLSVVHGADKLRVFGNFNGGDNTNQAKLYEWQGSFTQVGNVRVALDVPGAYLRTLGVARGVTGTCYAMLRLGVAYGQSSYYPAWAKSDTNCENWQIIKQKLWLGNSNSNTLNVDESAPATIDHTNPRNNRFTAVDDSFSKRLALTYSADGATWALHDVELWPVTAGGNPQFASEVKTQFGYHVIAADWSDSAGTATRHVHLYSCDGLRFRLLDASAPTFNGSKGTSLSYDPTTGDVHAITNGKHLSFKSSKLACA